MTKNSWGENDMKRFFPKHEPRDTDGLPFHVIDRTDKKPAGRFPEKWLADRNMAALNGELNEKNPAGA